MNGMETVIREYLSDFDTVMNVPAEARDLAQALRDAGYGDVAAAKAEGYDEGYSQCRHGGYPSVTYGSNLNPYRRAR